MAKKNHRRGNDGSAPVSNRQLKVGEEIRHALSDIFIRGDIFHSPQAPELRGASITVSEVRISPDLRDATAYVTPLGGQNTDKIVAGLNKLSGFIRGEVTRTVVMKYSPKIFFRADNSFEYINKIDSLLKKPEVARDLELSDKKE